MQNQFKEVAEIYQEEISATHVPLIKYFTIAWEKRSSYTRGIRLKRGISSSTSG